MKLLNPNNSYISYMENKGKHINKNLTVRVEYPSAKLLNFVRDLNVKKTLKKMKLRKTS